MATLPAATDYTGAAVTQGGKKTFMTTVRTFIADLLGTDSGDKKAARDTLGVPVENYLDNPDGTIYQRTVAATADDVYCFDRWYALTQTGTITPSQVSNPEDGFFKAMRLTQSQASAQRMGLAQIVPAATTSRLRGKTVTFGGRVKLSTSANVRMAILAWTGTGDSVTSDPVNDWTSSTYTTGNFFASSNLTLVATSSTAMTGATAANVSVSGAIPSGATNIIVLYWTEATAAQNVTLDAWGMRLIHASSLVEHLRKSEAEELDACQQRYMAGVIAITFQTSTTSTDNDLYQLFFTRQMAGAPTMGGTVAASGTLSSLSVTTSTAQHAIYRVNVSGAGVGSISGSYTASADL